VNAERVGARLTAASVVEEGGKRLKIIRSMRCIVPGDGSDRPLNEDLHFVDVDRRHEHWERPEIPCLDFAAAAEAARKIADAPAFAPGSGIVGRYTAGIGLNDDGHFPERRVNLGGEAVDDGVAMVPVVRQLDDDRPATFDDGRSPHKAPGTLFDRPAEIDGGSSLYSVVALRAENEEARGLVDLDAEAARTRDDLGICLGLTIQQVDEQVLNAAGCGQMGNIGAHHLHAETEAGTVEQEMVEVVKSGGGGKHDKRADALAIDGERTDDGRYPPLTLPDHDVDITGVEPAAGQRALSEIEELAATITINRRALGWVIDQVGEG
jgi:hypothetical protein